MTKKINMSGSILEHKIDHTPIDRTYTNLLTDILVNGSDKSDRTGTGTRSIFGRHIKHDMRAGFPLLNSKKMTTRGIVSELLWFLRGETNQTSIVKEGTKIWLGDGVKKWLKESNDVIMAHYCSHTNVILDVKLRSQGYDTNTSKLPHDSDKISYEFNLSSLYERIFVETEFDPINYKKDITNIFQWLLVNNTEFADEWGELGPIYGKQWRDWGGVDQIREVVDTLKSNPDSRRIIVNAWNVPEIKTATLPPCHWGFQFWTRDLTAEEFYAYSDQGVECPPTKGISLLWNQRSVDTFLGLPFNVASYALLLLIIGKSTNMVPLELNGFLGDVHLYHNHASAVSIQIERMKTEVIPEMCTIKLSNDIDWTADIDAIIHSLRYEDFIIENYNPLGRINAPLSN